MLKKLKLINFQGHENSTVIFSPRITGIIGVSLAGKSSLIRGLRWIKDNRPSGFKFHSHFAKKGSKTEAILDFDNSTIKAARSKKEHIYKINDNKPLRKFGRSVPSEIDELLNIGDINIQYEFDNPFLIRGSNPEIARAISKAVNTDIIENAITKIRKRNNVLKHERRFLKVDVEQIRERLEALDGLDKVTPLIKKVKKIGKQIDELGAEYDAIENIQTEIEKLEKKIEKTKSMLKAKPLLDEISEIDDRIENLELEKKDLEHLGNITSWISTAEQSHTKMVNQYIKSLRELGKCPTCFGPLNEKTIKRIKNEITI